MLILNVTSRQGKVKRATALFRTQHLTLQKDLPLETVWTVAAYVSAVPLVNPNLFLSRWVIGLPGCVSEYSGSHAVLKDCSLLPAHLGLK